MRQIHSRCSGTYKITPPLLCSSIGSRRRNKSADSCNINTPVVSGTTRKVSWNVFVTDNKLKGLKRLVFIHDTGWKSSHKPNLVLLELYWFGCTVSPNDPRLRRRIKNKCKKYTWLLLRYSNRSSLAIAHLIFVGHLQSHTCLGTLWPQFSFKIKIVVGKRKMVKLCVLLTGQTKHSRTLSTNLFPNFKKVSDANLSLRVFYGNKLSFKIT